MGDVSIMARRLKDGHVQYGWSGNGGYFNNVGQRLLLWYQNPEDVEYLFKLGQTKLIGKKGSENGGYSWYETHSLTGEGFWLDKTEKMIFSKIMFVDYGYFYDHDHKWYYIIPGPFRIKMPLELIANHLDKNGDEFKYLRKVENQVLQYMFTDYVEEDDEFKKYLEQNEFCPDKIIEGIRVEDGDLSMYFLYDRFYRIWKYFDDWILIKTNEDDTKITDIIIKKKEEVHTETNAW